MEAFKDYVNKYAMFGGAISVNYIYMSLHAVIFILATHHLFFVPIRATFEFCLIKLKN